MELLLWTRELPEMQFSSFRGDRFFSLIQYHIIIHLDPKLNS